MGQPLCYRRGLIDAIRIHLPWQFFARWKLMRRPALDAATALLGGHPDGPDGPADPGRTLYGRPRPVAHVVPAWCWVRPIRAGTSAGCAARKAVAGPGRATAATTTGVWPGRRGCVRAALPSPLTARGWSARGTAANEEALGCAGRTKTGPQLFVTTLWHMGTGLPWDFRIGPGTAGERRHLEEMLSDLPADALAVADAGFTGYDFYGRIAASGRAFLLRVGANGRAFAPSTGLLGSVRTPTRFTCGRTTDVRGRRWCYAYRGAGAGQAADVPGDQRLLDEKALPRKAAALLYEMRWGVEVFYRTTKQTLQKRKMLSRTPEAARCELTWAPLGVWLLGLMSVSAILGRFWYLLSWSAALCVGGCGRPCDWRRQTGRVGKAWSSAWRVPRTKLTRGKVRKRCDTGRTRRKTSPRGSLKNRVGQGTGNPLGEKG